MRVVPRATKHAVLFAGSSLLALGTSGAAVHAAQPFLFPGSLIVSASTYDNTHGAVANLTAGRTQLAGNAGVFQGQAPTCTTATAGNDYVHVWNNAGTDGSFGVTSPIQLADVNASTGQVLATLNVPTNQVDTSFSSKSELGLHYGFGPNGPQLTFVAYASPGVGALDVSNSDAVAGQDPTNPVTACFGSNNTYAFARTVVAVSKTGNLAFTPLLNYGGNNGRSALLGSNGLYYSVGNANNGGATQFGTQNNGTSPDVTETTGLEAIMPINASSPNVQPANSAEADPLLQFKFGTKKDKPGKDNNYRGVTEFGGALYFTKGSGSNGVDTVYSVSPGLPTLSQAPNATINIVPGFPMDSAKATGGNFTPFAVFFANATTMYVTDEGSGNATDASTHAGLEKWSLVNGAWTLDYTLISGLIGTSYTLGNYPMVTTAGLRNLSGAVNGSTVTLWATTSTTSGSGDQGADPNEVVTITDCLSCTTLPQNESFSVLKGPTYGSVYRGVAYVPK